MFYRTIPIATPCKYYTNTLWYVISLRIILEYVIGNKPGNYQVQFMFDLIVRKCLFIFLLDFFFITHKIFANSKVIFTIWPPNDTSEERMPLAQQNRCWALKINFNSADWYPQIKGDVPPKYNYFRIQFVQTVNQKGKPLASALLQRMRRFHCEEWGSQQQKITRDLVYYSKYGELRQDKSFFYWRF